MGRKRQKVGCNVAVHKANLGGVAHAGAAGFGIEQNRDRHVKVGSLIHINVADAGAGLNAGHRRVFHAGADQPRPTARDQQIHLALCGHQLVCALAGRVLYEANDIRVKPRGGSPGFQGRHNGGVALNRLFAAAQHAHTARL
ncbi:hypothetical protein SDC9_139294 [bioreactor metagenome]|uniref:Uncharacterized protein n=1 Tax=bioreactor metagenome TaxID=1076179 RepID=A0A645DSA7_9ZZZZ